MNLVHYLAAIAVKNYVAGILAAPTKFVTTEEVLAVDDNDAVEKAYEQFNRRCKYEPLMRLRMADLKLQPEKCYVAEVVTVD